MKATKLFATENIQNSFGVLVDWHKALGLKCKKTETNAGLAERDYTIDCKTGSQPIIVFEGYWIWWCTPHHQPFMWCERAKLQRIVATVKSSVS